MPLLLGRGQGWGETRLSPLEPEEEALITKIREAGPDGYRLETSEIVVSYSLYHRNLIVEHHDKEKTWTYVLGRGWR